MGKYIIIQKKKYSISEHNKENAIDDVKKEDNKTEDEFMS